MLRGWQPLPGLLGACQPETHSLGLWGGGGAGLGGRPKAAIVPVFVLGLACAPSGFTSYQRAFDDFLERCRQLRNYRGNVIANINNCLSLR